MCADVTGKSNVVEVNVISQDLTSPSVSTDTKNTALTLYLLLSYLLYSRQSIDAEEKDEHDAWSEGEYESEGPTGTENDDQLQSRASYVPVRICQNPTSGARVSHDQRHVYIFYYVYILP